MSKAHVCQLPRKDTSGLPKLSPNASFWKRLCRIFRKLIIVNPNSFKCKFFSNNKSVIMAEQRRHVKSPYSYMIHPLSTLSSFLEVSFFVLWLSKMVVEPVLGNMVEKPKILQYIDYYSIVTLQRALIISFFFLGYMDTKTKEIVIECRRVAKRYLKTFFFVDIFASELSAVITLTFTHFYIEDMQDVNIMLKVTDHMHIIFLYARLKTILMFLDDIGRMLGMRRIFRRCVMYIFRTFMYLHLFGCMLYYIPQIVYDTDWPSDSWLVVAKISPKQESRFLKIYGECLLTAVCYFFGAQAGQYDTFQTNEQISLTLIALFGRLYTLFLLADALNSFGISEVAESKYERTLYELKEYMVSKNLPCSLRHRMVRYYECKMQKHYFEEAEILNTLSENLRKEIYLFSARPLMRRSRFLKFLPSEEVAALISKMNLVTYAPGDILFTSGEQIQTVFFISSGSVAITTPEGHVLSYLEDGDALGLDLSNTHRRTYDAIAAETSDVYLIDSDVLHDSLEEYPMAIGYLNDLARERREFYKRVKETAAGLREDCLSELRRGKILERRRRRILSV